MDKETERDKKSFLFGKILFCFFYLTLFVGFYFGEDSSGSGGFIGDFNSTWGYIIALQEQLFVLPSQWVLHTPLHFLIVSKFYPIFESKVLLRLFYCSLGFLVPLIFYNCLKIKFPNINKSLLLFFACSIFLYPSFRSGMIWANDHITALIFFLIFLYFFLKWENTKSSLKLVLYQCFFLSLAVYTRQYYALIFFYCLFMYFNNFDFKRFIYICFFIFLITIPGFFLIYFDPILISTTFDSNISNTILVSSSILSFYLIPFYFIDTINKNSSKFFDKNFLLILCFSFFVIIFLVNFFNYNYKTGGGFFIKLSYLLFNNNYLFLITSILGMTFLLSLIRENKINSILITIMLIGFPAYMIFQKYYEPMFIFILFLLLKTNIVQNFFSLSRNLILYYLYIFMYLLSAIINDQLNLTKTLL